MIIEIDPEKEYIFRTKGDSMNKPREYKKLGKNLNLAEQTLVKTWLKAINK